MKRLLLMIVVAAAGLVVWAQDDPAVRAKILHDIGAEIVKMKVDYPELAGFSERNVLDGNAPAIVYDNAGKRIEIGFGTVHDPAAGNGAVRYSFLTDSNQPAPFINCVLTVDDALAERIAGLIKVLPGVKTCRPNTSNGVWDECEYPI